MLRIVRKLRYALLMTRAVRHTRDGNPAAAYETLKKAERWSDGRGGLLDAMLAYSSIGVGDSSGAREACGRVLDRSEPPSPDRKYIEEYCRYLQAVLSGDYRQYVQRRQTLRSMPRSDLVDDALRVDRLFVKDPSSESIN